METAEQADKVDKGAAPGRHLTREPVARATVEALKTRESWPSTIAPSSATAPRAASRRTHSSMASPVRRAALAVAVETALPRWAAPAAMAAMAAMAPRPRQVSFPPRTPEAEELQMTAT